MEDLTEIIEDSLADATFTPEPIESTQEPTTTPDPVEVAPEPSSEPTEPAQAAPEPSTQVPSPAAQPQDEFERKYGITAQSASGRENRIPYSRVKKITDKAIKEAVDARNKEVETGYVPSAKFAELETKVKDYDTKFQDVIEFERVMLKEQPRFLEMLKTIPGYAELLTPKPAEPVTPEVKLDPRAGMPQPDQELSDGSKVYSLDGLNALMEWQAAQVEARVTKQIEDSVTKRYGPLAEDYEQYQRVQQVIPKVQQEIAEARTWALFNESEDEIVKLLQANPKLSLEGAYNKVVIPKMQTSRDKMRTEILNEVKKAPKSTAAPTSPTKAATPPAGPRTLEQVIQDSIKDLK